jgi:hypothetical protein
MPEAPQLYDSRVNWQQTVRRKVFISYHKADADEVNRFIGLFSGAYDAFLARGIGAGMAGDIINSADSNYVMSRIRQQYLVDSSVTIVMIGNCTWSRKYVDWELQASLRSGLLTTPNGVLGVRLPSYNSGQYPERLNENLLSENSQREGRTECYARAMAWPVSAEELRLNIEDAYAARTRRAHLISNSRERFVSDRDCGHPWH